MTIPIINAFSMLCVLLHQTLLKNCILLQNPTHCETVCLLSNRKADSHIKLSLVMDEYFDIIEKEKVDNK